MSKLAEKIKEMGFKSVTEVKISELNNEVEKYEVGYNQRAIVLRYGDEYNITCNRNNCSVHEEDLEKGLKISLGDLSKFDVLVADFIILIFWKIK